MYKLIFALLFLPFLTRTAEAQDYDENYAHGYYAIDLGAAIPQASFRNTDIGLDFGQQKYRVVSGFANTGYAFGLEGGYVPKRFAGYCVSVQHCSNSFNTLPYQQFFHQVFLPSYQLQVGATNYSATTICAGMLLSYPFSKWAVDVRLMGGFGFFRTPAITYTFDSLSSGGVIEQTEGNSAALVLHIGAGIRYNINESFCFTAGFDYQSARPAYNDITFSSGGVPVIMPIDFRPGYYQLILKAGIGINISEETGTRSHPFENNMPGRRPGRLR